MHITAKVKVLYIIVDRLFILLIQRAQIMHVILMLRKSGSNKTIAALNDMIIKYYYADLKLGSVVSRL